MRAPARTQDNAAPRKGGWGESPPEGGLGGEAPREGGWGAPEKSEPRKDKQSWHWTEKVPLSAPQDRAIAESHTQWDPLPMTPPSGGYRSGLAFDVAPPSDDAPKGAIGFWAFGLNTASAA